MAVLQQLYLYVLLALVISAKKGDRSEDESIDGLQAASDFIKGSMNLQGDACNNFNDFKCGKLPEIVRRDFPELDGFTTWDAQTTNFTRRIVALLDDLEPEKTSMPDIFKKVKIMYDKCLSRAENQSLSASIAYVATVIDELGGSPMLDSSWSTPDRSIVSLALEIQKRFGAEFGISLSVMEDEDSIILRAYYSASRLSARTTAKLISAFARIAGQEIVSDDKVKRQIQEMKELDDDLDELEDIRWSDYKSVTIRLKDVYEVDVVTAKALAEYITNTTQIRINQAELKMLKSMKDIWGKYSKYRSALQNFLIGAYLNEVKTLLNLDSLFEEYGEHELLQSLASTAKNQSSESPKTETLGKIIGDLPTNKTECLQMLVTGYKNPLFEKTVLRLFVETYGPKKPEALELRNLVDLVREQIRKKFFNAAWMDYTSKIQAMNKLTSIIPRIAYPLWIMNDTAFTAHHSNIGQVGETDSYLKVLSQSMKNYWMNNLLLASRPLAQDFNDFGMTSFMMNAWYQPNRNAFALALGLIQPPFYRPDYPPAVIYGIIGAVIGHEIFHGFDTSGVHYSSEGSYEKWMTDESYEGFLERAQCVEDQYSNFCYNLTEDGYKKDEDEVNDYDYIGREIQCLDGEQTASENIADLDGLKAAYQAYKAYMDQNSGRGLQDTKPPGLEAFSWDQIFFLSYGSVWCTALSTSDLLSYIRYGVHSPGPSRINGTLQNLQVFADAFNCPFGTKMNPTEKCSVF